MELRQAALDVVVSHAREASPAECCGLLLGTAGIITEAHRANNLSPDPNRFLIDPADHIAARRDARVRGLEVVGFYHSHPRSAAVPSPTDLAEASYTDHLYLIVSLAGEPPDVRLYRLVAAGLRTHFEPSALNCELT